MTDRTREQLSPASEDFFQLHQPCSSLFSHPAEVKDWCQSIPSGDIFPLTPPDTASECAISDCQDMSAQTWNQAPLPEGSWSSGSTSDCMPNVSVSRSDWTGHHFQEDLDQLNASAWLNTPSTVDMGLSPVLSYESQSSHTLQSFSEPDVSMLPLNLDLTFADSSWTPHGQMPYSTLDIPAQPQASTYIMASPSPATYRRSMESQPMWPVSQPEVAHAGNPQHVQYAALPMHATSYPSVVSKRPLLPRTEPPAAPSQPIYGPQRMLRPSVPKPLSSQVSAPSVSTLSISPYGVPRQMPVHGRGRHGVPTSSGLQFQAQPYAPACSTITGRQEHGPQNQSQGISTHNSEHGFEDFSDFLQFDPEEQVPLPEAVRPHTGYKSVQAAGPYVKVPEPESVAKPEPSATPNYQVQSPAAPHLSNDQEEGRHRTHVLYSEGPRPDGLYHCPFASDPSCLHKPTKLKCNYDKFIDSHIKPFRCKVESCAKQEFSSTACLLRHEREAHGMHGHGERPHLCYYAGCERGLAGNGFPRRYNLFDHMKRVHDHKEDVNSLTGSPALSGELQGQARGGGRKRKASGPNSGEPSSQRQRSTVSHSLPSHQPGPSYPIGYSQAMETPPQSRNTQYRQPDIHSQWATQRELLARQLDFVQSPEDEDNLQRLSQNIEEFRRLSQEVRRG